MTDHKTLELMGSGEFEPWSEEVDRFSLDRADFGDGSVVILPTASAPEGEEVFNRWAGMGLDHFKKMGVHTRVVDLKTREDAFLGVLIEELASPSMIFFSGGNPSYLAATLEDTPFWKAILDAVARGTALAGCSAGACFIGESAPDSTALTLEEITWRHGLGVVKDTSFGPHWDMLESYLPGLQEFILSNVPDDQLFIGLDERTAMAGDGEVWQVFGLAGVHACWKGEWTTFRAGETFTLSDLRG
ncbi:MAG: Type 1 glutamine amidotransferase-like domain-containing protein [Actinomycetota bacterium]